MPTPKRVRVRTVSGPNKRYGLAGDEYRRLEIWPGGRIVLGPIRQKKT